MDATRWCFAPICQTLLTCECVCGKLSTIAERKCKKNDQEVYLCSAVYVRPLPTACLSCLNGSDGAATRALGQAGCIRVSTDLTPPQFALASIKVHLSGFYRTNNHSVFFKGGLKQKENGGKHESATKEKSSKRAKRWTHKFTQKKNWRVQ